MRIVKAGAIIGIAAAGVTGWMFVPPAMGGAAPAPAAITFYLSPTGSDSASGTSPSHPWRTIGRANQAVLQPGDRLLLRGGHRFAGVLQIGPGEAGSAARPVVIGSYGTGRATIASTSSGVVVFDTAGITIHNLVIAGDRAKRPGTAGVQVFSDHRGQRLNSLLIRNVDVSGFGTGIAIGAKHDSGGFRNVRILDSMLHGNLDAGLQTYGPAFNRAAPGYAHANITLTGVRAFSNLGDPHDTTSNSGSGIVLSSVTHATVTWSSAFGNGGLGAIVGQGPVGIWAYDSTKVVFAHDVSHGNKTRSQQDGAGFGLDQNTSDSIIEYDLTYGNHGPGFLLYAAPATASQSGNIIRFNISWHDALTRFALGGIDVGGRVRDAHVYQNTVVMPATGTQPALKLTGPASHVTVANNIFVAPKAGSAVLAVTAMPTSQFLLAGNDYRATGTTWTAIWGTRRYHSLAAWRAATGQERVGGRSLGRRADPSFVGPVSGPAGGAGFMLRRGSPLRGIGLNLRLRFGFNPGLVTYAGKRYPASRPNLGAQ